ncbi:hypothetical protein AcW2_000482 [Taiwanofungus camphoratus]|nr:hypothetical protein AcW2_000482 [Antrodia cinnamomea]
MASELSLRHLPDLSDASMNPDFSDSSFQIPHAAESSTDLLLADDSMDLLRNADDTLSTPAQLNTARRNQPLALQELTPKIRAGHAAPVRSSLRPGPGIATPFRTAVTKNLATALTEELSPLRNHDVTCQDISATAKENKFYSIQNGPDTHNGTASDTFLPPEHREPLTLSQLTPRPHRMSPPPCRPSCQDMSGIDPMSRPTFEQRGHHIGQAKADVTVTRIAAAATHISPPPMPKAQESNVRNSSAKQRKEALRGGSTRRKQVVLKGGISKLGKQKPPRSIVTCKSSTNASKKIGISKQVPPENGIIQLVEEDSLCSTTKASQPGNDILGDQSTSTTGLAVTLMSYGRKYIQDSTRSECHAEDVDQATANATMSANSGPEPVTKQEAAPWAVSAELNCDPDREQPLSLSQLTPTPVSEAPVFIQTRHESDVAGPADTIRPPSPVHPSIKRPTSAAPDTSSVRHKRNKPDPVVSEQRSSTRAVKNMRLLQPSRVKNTVTSGSTSSSHVRQTTADPCAKGKGKESRAESSTSNSRSSSVAGQDEENAWKAQLTDGRSTPASLSTASRSGGSHAGRRRNLPDAGKARRLPHEQGDGHLHKAGQMPSFDRPAATLPPAKPTRTIAFHFQSDARVEARKAELQKSSNSLARSKAHAPLPIPDFKAMHAAQESKLAARKEQIMPIVPMEVELYTDVRAREREKYDEARKEREREIELQMEERRRLRALEEEKEIKELRKRAVPKANEIPDWYANAPKRTGNTKT